MSQIIQYDARLKTVRGALEGIKPQLQEALPKHISAGRMLRVCMGAVRQNPQLLECDPGSFLSAVLLSAQMGLEPDGVSGQSYLIPYRKKGGGRIVQFQIGYRGMTALAYRSDKVVSIRARVVYDSDHFYYEYGLKERLEHRPAGAQGKITHVYARAHMADGSTEFEVMSLAEVEAIRAKSPAASSGPWVTHFGEMAKKTVIKRLCKTLPTSIEMQRAISIDDLGHAGIEQPLPTIEQPISDVPVEPQDGSAADFTSDCLDPIPDEEG